MAGRTRRLEKSRSEPGAGVHAHPWGDGRGQGPEVLWARRESNQTAAAADRRVHIQRPVGRGAAGFRSEWKGLPAVGRAGAVRRAEGLIQSRGSERAGPDLVVRAGVL